MNLPEDADFVELEIFNLLIKNVYEPKTNANIYAQIDDPIDKFIVCYVFDLGRTQKEAEVALGMCKTNIWSRIKKIKEKIRPYANENNLLK